MVHDANVHRAAALPIPAAPARVPLMDDENPCAVIRRYFASAASSPAVQHVGEAMSVSQNCGLRDAAGTPTPIRYVIATVPHPVHTRLGLTFDRYTESLLRAADNAGYALHEYWLPWTSGTAAAAKDKKSEAELRGRENLPGILFFRAPAPCPDPLAILLVPETPVAGINKDAFRAALAIVPSETVAVVGPSFSGSFDSLSKLAAEAVGRHFEVVSGSATATAERASFAAELNQSGRGHFSATIHDDTSAFRELVNEICERSGGKAVIATLSESSTTYASQAGRDAQGGRTRPPQKISSCSVYPIRFPREISRLRNAYGEHPELAAVNGIRSTPSPTQSLPLDLRDSHVGDDTVPVLATTQTPVSQEAVLQNVANELRALKVNSAVLLATDPLDGIFIARFVRAACPNIRVIARSCDVLFARAAMENPFTGVLTFTTYPLLSGNPLELRKSSGSALAEYSFASSEALGVYNAAIIALNKAGFYYARDPAPIAGLPLFEPREPAAVEGDKQPQPSAIWVTVLTRTGYWPVGARGHAEDAKPLPLRPSLAYKLSFALPVCFCVLLWAGRHRGAGRPFDAILTSAAFCTVAAILVVLLMPFAGGYSGGARLTGLSFLLFATAAAAVASARPAIVEPAAPRRQWIVAAIPAVVLLVYALACYEVYDNPRDLTGVFASYRALDLFDGVSPVLPLLLLLAALFWWSHAHRSLRHAATVWSAEAPGNLLFTWMGIATSRIEAVVAGRFLPIVTIREGGLLSRGLDFLRVTRYFSVQDILSALVFTFVCALVFFWNRAHLHTFEPAPYDALYSATFALVAGTVLVAAIRYTCVWLELRTVLQRLDIYPLREPFERMPTQRAWTPLFAQDHNQRSRIDLYREVACRIVNAKEFSAQPWAAEFRRSFDVLNQLGPAERLDKAHDALKSLAEILSSQFLVLTAPQCSERRFGLFGFDGRNELIAAAIEYLAVASYQFIDHTLRQMRKLLYFVTGAFVLGAVSMLSYPFSESGAIANFLLIALIAIGAIVIWVLAEADRDAVLSRINNTVAGKISVAFVQKLAIVGGFPLFAVMAAYFPQIGRVVGSILTGGQGGTP